MNKLKKPLTIEIDGVLWEEFKKRVSRGTKLNDAVVRLISTFVYENKFNIDLNEVKNGNKK